MGIIIIKSVREWYINTYTVNRLGTKNKGAEVKCIDFTDDMVLPDETWEEPKNRPYKYKNKQKMGLKISPENTKIMKNKVSTVIF